MLNDLVIYGVAVAIRLWLGGDEDSDLSQRPEISTPLNSWKRLTEGVHMYTSGQSPYQGVVYHETPLALVLFSLIQGQSAKLASWLFILGDLATCVALAKLAEVVVRQRLVEQEQARAGYHKEARPLLASISSVISTPRLMSVCYLLNPYVVLSCSARTSTVWTNLCLSLFLLSMVNCWQVLACVTLALATYQSLYPGLLIVPLILQLCKQKDAITKKVIVSTIGLFAVCIAVLLLISFEICGDWSFLGATYGFILTVPELTPNMGIFWYFFTDMFDHFRTFFVWTFQLNLLMYVAPLSIKFPRQPLLLSTVLVGLVAVFKSYPAMGDLGFFLSLLPLFSNLVPFMKQTLIIGGMLLATTVLAPIAWQLWIYNNSANANYYFAINLVYGTAQIFLITDLLFAQVKREFHLYNGFSVLEKEDKDGRRPTLQLK